MDKYEVVIGMDHEKGRQEPGHVYKGPQESIPALLRQGAIRKVTDEKSAGAAGGSDARSR